MATVGGYPISPEGRRELSQLTRDGLNRTLQSSSLVAVLLRGTSHSHKRWPITSVFRLLVRGAQLILNLTMFELMITRQM